MSTGTDAAVPSPPYGTLGAFMIGVAVSLAIFGILAIQAINYFKHYPNDHIGVKLTVILLLLVETMNSSFQTSALYYFVVSHRSDISTLSNPPWQLNAPVALNASSGTIVQLFFARRVYIMSDHNIWLTALIIGLSISQLATSWGIAILSIKFPSATDAGKYASLTIPAFTLTAAADITIACSLVYFLQIRKTGHHSTNTLVNKLIFLTINNGALSSLIALTALVVVVVAPQTMAPYAVCFILTKTYSATLLTSLNSRRKSRNTLSRNISSRSRSHKGELIKLQEQSLNGFGTGTGVTITREVTTVFS